MSCRSTRRTFDFDSARGVRIGSLSDLDVADLSLEWGPVVLDCAISRNVRAPWLDEAFSRWVGERDDTLECQNRVLGRLQVGRGSDIMSINIRY